MSTSAPFDRPQPVTARGQQTRQNLLDAAEAVFGEVGFERASITALTRRAGVAQGTFYVYFPDKQSIFVELVRVLSHQVRQEMAEAVVGLTDRLQIERMGFRVFFNFIHHHRSMYKIVRQAEFVDEELYRWYYRRLADGYIHGLSQAMDSGQIRRMDPEVLAYCLMGMGDFLGMRWVLWQEKDGLPDAVFEQFMAFIEQAMRLPSLIPPTV